MTVEPAPSIAAQKWNTAHQVPNFRRRFLNSIPWVQTYIHKLYLNGDSPFGLLRTALGDVPVESALELAGGRGDFALSLLRSGLARNVEMRDISEAAITIAREKATQQGIAGLTVGVADVNTVHIAESYDLIAFSQSLHHIAGLEHVLAEVKRALKPGGVFFVSDYIGPTQMQWHDDQLRIMNDLLALLPEQLRMPLNPDGSAAAAPKRRVKRIAPEIFEAFDPSEAVRSGEIGAQIRANFSDVAFYPMGGAFTYEMFRMIAYNFDTDDAVVQALVKTILYFESELIAAGTVTPCFGMFVCRA